MTTIFPDIYKTALAAWFKNDPLTILAHCKEEKINPDLDLEHSTFRTLATKEKDLIGSIIESDPHQKLLPHMTYVAVEDLYESKYRYRVENYLGSHDLETVDGERGLTESIYMANEQALEEVLKLWVGHLYVQELVDRTGMFSRAEEASEWASELIVDMAQSTNVFVVAYSSDSLTSMSACKHCSNGVELVSVLDNDFDLSQAVAEEVSNAIGDRCRH